MPQSAAPAGFVPVESIAFGRLGDEAVPVTDASPLPAYMPGGLTVVTASVTRPADVVAYAAGDLVANSANAGSVAPIELAAATRAAVEAIRIERVRLRKTSPTLTGASFRVHLFRRLPVVTVGDNGVFDNGTGALSVADVVGYIGSVDIVMDRSGTASAVGAGTPTGAAGITCETGAVAGKERSLWALIEARAAYVPISGEAFTIMVEGARS